MATALATISDRGGVAGPGALQFDGRQRLVLGQESQDNPFLLGELALAVGIEEEFDDRRIEEMRFEPPPKTAVSSGRRCR